MKKIIVNLMVIIGVLAVSYPLTANAYNTNMMKVSNLQTFTGQPITQDKNKLTHLVFIDVWRSYEGKGDEKMIAALPNIFLKQSQQIWIQPEINVTNAQLAEFQQYFSHIKPLVIDKKFALMRAFNVWQSPFHVLLEDNKKIFSGDATALSAFITQKYNLVSNQSSAVVEKINDTENNIEKTTLAVKHTKPLIGDLAPSFTANTLTEQQVTLSATLAKLTNNKPLNLIFLDALCPMPQFPGCEAKIAQLNKLMKVDNKREWLAVVNSYYVNEDYVKDFVKKFDLKLPIIFDQNNQIYRAYDVYASPYQIKVNRQGFIESRSDSIN